MKAIRTLSFARLYARQLSLRPTAVISHRRYLATTVTTAWLPKDSPIGLPPVTSVTEQYEPADFVLNKAKAASMYPPGHPGEIGELSTYILPDVVTEDLANIELGKRLIRTFRKDGILQVAIPKGLSVLRDALNQSKEYFARSHAEKSKCVDSQSFAGYIASGEELTDGVADYSEIFTVTKDLPLTDRRVLNRWPCHGPTPWPTKSYGEAMTKYMEHKGQIGKKLLKLLGLGLGLEDPDYLNKLTQDGWHHLRVLRFPAVNATNGKGVEGRGIGSHTDYGLLVIAAQDDVGGLFIRKPLLGEVYANWDKTSSSAGLHEMDDKWTYVPPMENVFTVFPGDMMQFMTNSYLPSTPHKVALNTSTRYAMAYFHEPNFNAVVRELDQFKKPGEGDKGSIHYGTHFTNMFMRNYPQRVTAKRIIEENRMDILERLKTESEAGLAFCP